MMDPFYGQGFGAKNPFQIAISCHSGTRLVVSNTNPHRELWVYVGWFPKKPGFHGTGFEAKDEPWP